MNSDDPLRAALRRLLRGTDQQPAGSPERRREVAHQAGVNPDTLYQVASGVLLPSGSPRSVGRPMRQKLDAAFPNWLDGIGEDGEQRGGTRPSQDSQQDVRDALSLIRDRLAALSGESSDAAGEALRLLAKVPDSDRAFQQAVALLTSSQK